MSKTAWLFPGQGQGTVSPGMGRDIWEESEAAREIFFQASLHLRRPIADLCFFSPEEELFRTVNSQLVVLVSSLAYVAVQNQLEREGTDLGSFPRVVSPDFLAGHSVGYLTALVHARAITFFQALDIVEKRAFFMSEACRANPGKMVVLIEPKNEEVQELQQELSLGGNLNSETQIVLSGPIELMEEAIRRVKKGKLAKKVFPLKTEGAFHSSCMRPAKEALRKYLEPISFSAPMVPIIGNSRAQIIRTSEESRAELSDHLDRPVLWHESMQVLRQQGVTRSVEIGYGEVLSNNLKRSLVGTAIAAVSLSAIIGTYYYLVRHRRNL